jgi:ATP-dependent Lon protease
MPPGVAEEASEELEQLISIGAGTPDGRRLCEHLDWLTTVPWSSYSDDRLDPLHRQLAGTPLRVLSLRPVGAGGA